MSQSSDSQTIEFQEAFRKAHESIGLSSQKDEGANVVGLLFEYIRPLLSHSHTLVQEFPNHGIQHVIHMAKFFANEFAKDWEDEFKGKAWVSPHFLVLLFSAIAVHDIAMGILDDDIEFLKCIVERKSRQNHVKRSLKFVEEKIFVNPYRIPPQSLIESESPKNFLDAWNSFWDQAENWPKPASEIARICLLRACQAHGDDNPEFMNLSSMIKYKRQGTGKFLAPTFDPVSKNNNGKDNVYDLNAYCKRYNETISDEIPIFLKTLVAASAFLCLCDLCDIGRGRYDRCPQTTLEKLDMENLGIVSIRETYWHRLGHILGKISLEKGGKINVEIKRRTKDEYLLYSLVLRSGPIKALLYWGNHSNLLDVFKNLLNFSYCGIEPSISVTADLPAWDTAFKECQKNRLTSYGS